MCLMTHPPVHPRREVPGPRCPLSAPSRRSGVFRLAFFSLSSDTTAWLGFCLGFFLSTAVVAGGMSAAGESPSSSDLESTAIPVPNSLPPAAKLALTHSELFELKGSSFRIMCKICGFKATTSAHKLVYGHYLREPGNDIGTCIAVEKLKADYPEFYNQLATKRDTLNRKRKSSPSLRLGASLPLSFFVS